MDKKICKIDKSSLQNQNKIKICAYCRVSTKEENQENSLINQIEYYKKLISSNNNWKFCGIFADQHSGKNIKDRSAFKEMVQNARRGEIDKIFCKSINRFGRNLIETLEVIRELRDLGIEIIFESQNIKTLDSSSDFILSIYAIIAEAELESISQNIKWTIRRNFKEGKPSIQALLGYDVFKGQMIINYKEAEIIKKIFNMFIDGLSIHKIAAILNLEKIQGKYKSQKIWTYSQIKKILLNEKYVGNVITQKTFSEHFKIRVNQGQLPQYFFENHHEAIIDLELFNKAQELLNDIRKNETKRSKTTHGTSMFASKIVCLNCMRKYIRRFFSKDEDKYIWICRTYSEYGNLICKSLRIDNTVLEQLFFEATEEMTKMRKNLDDDKNNQNTIQDLLNKEKELRRLHAKRYITDLYFKKEQTRLLEEIKIANEEYVKSIELKKNNDIYKNLKCIKVNATNRTLYFEFKNGISIPKIYHKDSIGNMDTKIIKPYYSKNYLAQKLESQKKYLNVAAYCRVSTNSEDQQNSFENQSKYFKKVIESKENWNLVKIYADEGISGTSLRKRKQFMQMINDALNGKIDLIITKSVSRYARNTVDALSTIRKLLDKNVKVYFEKENIYSDDAKCSFILSIFSTLAEEESRSISNNIKWAIAKKLEKGQVHFDFRRMYGYDVDEDKNIIIDETQAEVVKDIYFYYLQGKSLQEIARILERKGIKTQNGRNKWYSITIYNILTNEKYQGDVITMKTYKTDVLSKRKQNNGQVTQSYISFNHPAIISKEQFAAVQSQLQRRRELRDTTKTGKSKYTGMYPFSGKIVCFECGSGYRRHLFKGSKKDEAVWVCKNHISNDKTCKALPIKEYVLEKMFLLALNNVLLNKQDVINNLSKKINQLLNKASVKNIELEQVEQEIGKLQVAVMETNERRNLNELSSENYNKEISAITKTLDNLFIKREKIKKDYLNNKYENIQNKMITDFLNNYKGYLEKFDRDIFVQLVDRVTIITRENIIISFRNNVEVNILKYSQKNDININNYKITINYVE